jgi:hypothetical protein
LPEFPADLVDMETCGLVDEVSEAIRLEYEIDVELSLEQYLCEDGLELDAFQFDLSETSQESLLLCPYCRFYNHKYYESCLNMLVAVWCGDMYE